MLSLPSAAFALFASILGLSAAPIDCVPGTLQDYINLGSTGCALSGKVIANFSELEIPDAATRIPAGSILVTPLDTPLMPSLTFSVDLTATAGSFFDSHFGYSLSAGNPIQGVGLTLADPPVTGDGIITVIKESCFSGTPDGVSCATPAGDTLIVLAIAGDSTLTAFTPLVSPASLLFVGEDIGIDGGLVGSASFTSTTNTFFASAPVPEPSTWILTALGLLLLPATIRRRRQNPS
jgi:hypothetical protein